MHDTLQRFDGLSIGVSNLAAQGPEAGGCAVEHFAAQSDLGVYLSGNFRNVGDVRCDVGKDGAEVVATGECRAGAPEHFDGVGQFQQFLAGQDSAEARAIQWVGGVARRVEIRVAGPFEVRHAVARLLLEPLDLCRGIDGRDVARKVFGGGKRRMLSERRLHRRIVEGDERLAPDGIVGGRFFRPRGANGFQGGHPFSFSILPPSRVSLITRARTSFRPVSSIAGQPGIAESGGIWFRRHTNI